MRGPRWLLAVLVILTALALQVSVVPRIPLPGATPDVLLLGVVGLALAYGSTFGAGAGFAAGLALDLVPPSDHALGRWAFVYTLVGFLAGRGERESERSAFVPFVAVAVASVAAPLAYAVMGVLGGDDRVSGSVVIGLLPTALLYDVVLTPFIVSGVLLLAQRVERPSLRR